MSLEWRIAMEEMMNLEGEGLDLKLLSRSFPTGPVRVEEHEERYYLILESEGPREDAAVLADGTNVLAQMTAIMLKDGPNFRPPRIRGATKKMPDGSLRTFLNMKVNIEARTAMFVNVKAYRTKGRDCSKQRANRRSSHTGTCGQKRTIPAGASNLRHVGTRLGKLVQCA
jgi:hypothetical protein